LLVENNSKAIKLYNNYPTWGNKNIYDIIYTRIYTRAMNAKIFKIILMFAVHVH